MQIHANTVRFGAKDKLTSTFSTYLGGEFALKPGDLLFELNQPKEDASSWNSTQTGNAPSPTAKFWGTVISVEPHGGNTDDFGRSVPEGFSKRDGDDKVDLLTFLSPEGKTVRTLAGDAFNINSHASLNEDRRFHLYFDLDPKIEGKSNLYRFFNFPHLMEEIGQRFEVLNNVIRGHVGTIATQKTQIGAYLAAFKAIGEGAGIKPPTGK